MLRKNVERKRANIGEYFALLGRGPSAAGRSSRSLHLSSGHNTALSRPEGPASRRTYMFSPGDPTAEGPR
jgi:hypothetical protein